MKKLQATVARLVRDDRGQDLIEYALLAGFISLVALIAIIALGGGINDVYTSLVDKIKGVPK